MRARILIGAAATGGMLFVLAVMCVVVAQNPPTKSRSKAAESANEIPSFASETPRAAGDVQVPLVPAFPSRINAAADDQAIFSAAATSPRPGRPAVIELTNGLKLTGHLAAAPIPFQVMFGHVALPLETIRGIRIADPVRSDVGSPQLISATIILENGDSLTGMPRVDVIQLQTEWGEAVVKLTHLKSVVLTSDDVIWEEHDRRWRLVPPQPPPAQSEDTAAPPPIDPAADLPPPPLNPATVPAVPTVPASDSLR